MVDKPYTDKQLADKRWIRRLFVDQITEDQLVWHRDANDRRIIVLAGEGWKIQLENELPVDLLTSNLYIIKKNTFHRIIKGKTNLILYIRED